MRNVIKTALLSMLMVVFSGGAFAAVVENNLCSRTVTNSSKSAYQEAYQCFNEAFNIAENTEYPVFAEFAANKYAANRYATNAKKNTTYVTYQRSFWGGAGYRFNRVGPSSTRGTFIFDPNSRKFGFYDTSGRLVKSGRASGGGDYCPDVGRSCHTPVGRFRVYAKGSVDCVSNTYPLGVGGAPMPYCMHFNGGYAIHGSNYVPTHFNASHGCIRLQPPVAQELHRSHIQHGTQVIVLPYRYRR